MILVVSDRPWVAAAFVKWTQAWYDNPDATALVTTPRALAEVFDYIRPDAMIFPHWSHHVSASMYNLVRCIGFHLGDLPQGRGGTPLQNLLVRGIYKTHLCAFKITEEMDAGPVYLREPVDLSEGSAEMIYQDLARRSLRMAEKILRDDVQPKPQVGRPTVWKRRTPEDSLIPKGLSVTGLYDYIRMLDAPGYPRAFMAAAGYRLTFSNARLTPTGILADVQIAELS